MTVKNVKVGDYIEFGRYPQIANGDIQSIEWQVLAIEENKMLLISQYALEAMRFDEDSNNWECSEIRKWLNGYFYNKVFNDNEKKNINSFDGDNVFLMSKEEAEKYFANNEARKCKSTEYAKKNGAWVAGSHYGDKVAGYSVWWLRSSRGKSVLYVSSGGKFYYSGVDYATVVVRPALWINI